MKFFYNMTYCIVFQKSSVNNLFFNKPPKSNLHNQELKIINYKSIGK